MEILATLLHQFGISFNASTLMGIMNNLYREDLFYYDKSFKYISGRQVTPHFQLFSERFAELYPEYMLDAEMLIRPRPGTRTVNLKALMQYLKAKKDTDLQ
jgi:hypothetical protein